MLVPTSNRKGKAKQLTKESAAKQALQPRNETVSDQAEETRRVKRRKLSGDEELAPPKPTSTVPHHSHHSPPAASDRPNPPPAAEPTAHEPESIVDDFTNGPDFGTAVDFELLNVVPDAAILPWRRTPLTAQADRAEPDAQYDPSIYLPPAVSYIIEGTLFLSIDTTEPALTGVNT